MNASLTTCQLPTEPDLVTFFLKSICIVSVRSCVPRQQQMMQNINLLPRTCQIYVTMIQLHVNAISVRRKQARQQNYVYTLSHIVLFKHLLKC